jgi:hypothetical protein
MGETGPETAGLTADGWRVARGVPPGGRAQRDEVSPVAQTSRGRGIPLRVSRIAGVRPSATSQHARVQRRPSRGAPEHGAAPAEKVEVRVVKVVPRVIPALLCLLLGACALTSTNTAGPLVTPIPTVTVPQRPPVIAQYCVEDTDAYPRVEFTTANKKVAGSLQNAVVPNSMGLNLYASLIVSNTLEAGNTKYPFLIPPIANYPALPTPLPTPADSNPISYGATATAAANAQNAAIQDYNNQMIAFNNQLQDEKTQVTNDTQRLITWNPQTDHGAYISVWGCLQLARNRFSGQAGTKYLIIASTMDDTSGQDYTSDFASSKALQGVIVNVIYFYCTTADPCQNAKQYWSSVFTSAGAASVQYYDPAESNALPTVFGGA